MVKVICFEVGRGKEPQHSSLTFATLSQPTVWRMFELNANYQSWAEFSANSSSIMANAFCTAVISKAFFPLLGK
jgi:hypothetical protein